MKPDQLLTLETLQSVGGASLAVTLVGNTVRYFFGREPRWLALVAAFAIAGLALAGKPALFWPDFVVAFFQGLQIFAAAVGISTIAATPTAVERSRALPAKERHFWVAWF